MKTRESGEQRDDDTQPSPLDAGSTSPIADLRHEATDFALREAASREALHELRDSLRSAPPTAFERATIELGLLDEVNRVEGLIRGVHEPLGIIERLHRDLGMESGSAATRFMRAVEPLGIIERLHLEVGVEFGSAATRFAAQAGQFRDIARLRADLDALRGMPTDTLREVDALRRARIPNFISEGARLDRAFGRYVAPRRPPGPTTTPPGEAQPSPRADENLSEAASRRSSLLNELVSLSQEMLDEVTFRVRGPGGEGRAPGTSTRVQARELIRWAEERRMLGVVEQALRDTLRRTSHPMTSHVSAPLEASTVEDIPFAMARKALRQVLAKLWDGGGRIRMVVDDLAMNAARISFAASADEVWHAVLREAEHTRALTRLLEYVMSEYPHHPDLSRIDVDLLLSRERS